MWAIVLFIFTRFMILYHLQYLGQGSLSRKAFPWKLMGLFFSSTSCPSRKSSSNSLLSKRIHEYMRRGMEASGSFKAG